MRGQLNRLAEKVARRLRHEGLRGRTIHLKARHPDFTTMTRSATLPAPTALTLVIRDAACTCSKNTWDMTDIRCACWEFPVSNLIRAGEGQIDLFQDGRLERYGKIDRLLDQLQDSHRPCGSPTRHSSA